MRIFSCLSFLLAGALQCQSPVRQPVFDGDKAFVQLQKQCDFGPRAPGTAGWRNCRDYLIRTLQTYADQTLQHSFALEFGRPRRTVEAINIIARFQPQKEQRLLLCAHWDTRPWADMDPLPQNRQTPILGANDGASGVAVLLELARLLHAHKPALGVDLVLFDGEDSGESHSPESYARGSAAFARDWGSRLHPRFAILLDMIGDKDLQIFYEAHSLQYAPQIVHKVWQQARLLGVNEFIAQEGYAVYDDHVPLLAAGIPCIDIIDFDYPYWHTLQDIPANCSKQSLEKVGRVITAIVYGEK